MHRRWWAFVLLYSAFGMIKFGATSEEKTDDKEDEPENDYLYSEKDAFPVVEYRSRWEVDPGHPRFLFGAKNGPRVVEFYAPWCPHCQHFRDRYVLLAKQVNNLVDEIGAAKVQFHAVSCTVNRPLCREFGVRGYPKIRLLPAGARGVNQSIEAHYWDLHPFSILNDLGIELGEMKLDSLTESRASTQLEQATATDSYFRTKQNIFDDAFLSFDFSMRNGIFTSNKPLSNTTQDALWDWLDLLSRALPPSWTIHKTVKGLLNNFDNITKSEESLVSVMDGFPHPTTKSWSDSCTKGKKGMGYTCGLWELFHIISIGIVEWNLMLDEEQDDILIPVTQAADTIHQFIVNFFGCEECRTNFDMAYASCAHDRCNRLKEDAFGLDAWYQLPLWLHETHNAVNVRLMKEKAKRERKDTTHHDEGRVVWPSHDACAECWTESGEREASLYKFLRIEYWPEDALTVQYLRELYGTEATATGRMPQPRTLIASILVLVVCIVAAQHQFIRMNRAKTGRHKKTDPYLLLG